MADTPPAILAAVRRLPAAHPWRTYPAARAARHDYGDRGQWWALDYALNGTADSARQAITAFLPVVTNAALGADANFVREYGADYTLWCSWVKDRATADEWAALAGGLDKWAATVLHEPGTPAYIGGWRLSDTDQNWGQYLFLDRLGRLLGKDYLSLPALGPSGNDLGGTVRDVVRPALVRYLTGASAGGAYITGTDYELDEVPLFVCGSADDPAAWPEVTAWAKEAAAWQQVCVTPDLAGPVQYGDEEHAGGFNVIRRVPFLCCLHALTGDAECLRQLKAFTAGGIDSWALVGWRAWYLFDPAVLDAAPAPDPTPDPEPPPPPPPPPPDPDPTPVPLTYLHVSDGNGHARFKRDDSLVVVHHPRRWNLDHEVDYVGDVRWWLGGEWVLQHPLGYGGAAALAECHNAPVFAGLSSMSARGPVSRTETADGFMASCGTSGPPHEDNNYAPPAFVTHTRDVRYVHPGKLTVVDHFAGAHPSTLPRFNTYSAGDLAKINAAPALWQQVWHCPVQPAVSGSAVTWRTALGKTVRVTGPAGVRVVVYDDKVVWPNWAAGLAANQPAWQFRFLSDDGTADIATAAEVL